MNTSMKFKSMLVATPLEGIAKRLQWAIGAKNRIAHPELIELHLDQVRIDEVVRRLTKPTSNILDVGCHIGSFLSLALKVSPKGKHIAIEALPDKAAALKRKFPTVRIEATAVSDICGNAVFERNLTHPGHSRLRDGMKTHGELRQVEVKVTTIDNLDLGAVDFVKMDIEGAELYALKGGQQFFRQRPPFIFEYGVAEYGKQNPEPIYRYVTETMGYKIFTFCDFLYDKGPLSLDEMRKCGLYPFRAFNFVALP